MRVKDAVLQTLRAGARPLGAYDVIRYLEPSRGKLAPTTVYRALNALVSAGQVHRIESLNAYVACPSQSCAAARHDATAFAICEDCGAVSEHQDDALARSLDALADRYGFRAERHVIEIHGRCGACGKSASDGGGA